MNTLAILTIAVYLIAAISQVKLVVYNQLAKSKRLLLSLGLLAVGLHAIVLYQTLFAPQGINLGFFNAASLVAWVIVLLLVFTLFRNPLENMVIILFPLAALTIGMEYYFPSERILLYEKGIGVKTHILSSILAYSLLTISTLQALFLAIQDHYLHNHHPGWLIQRLPPLQIMENLLFQTISFGVLLLTLSLFSGFLYLENIFAQHLVHKTILSISAWVIFSILLWGHWQYGWRGRTAIRWCLAGFTLLMLAYFGSKLVLELILHRG